MKGARPLFFSGGTALKGIARELARQAIWSIHIVTTFDSGGSSAALRRAFGIPAVGDLRNRLLALADTGKTPPALLELCNHRLGTDDGAKGELQKLADPDASIWQQIPADDAAIIMHAIALFLKEMPDSFDARGASIGNLLLATSYLANHRDFVPAITMFANLIQARGTVLPVDNCGLHLGAVLADGAIVCGQHLFRQLPAPIEKLFLTVHDPWSQSPKGAIACAPPLTAINGVWIGSATAICYPMGSFYSSVLANLLPRGTGWAVAQNVCPKIFIPNSGHDPELHGLDLCGQSRAIVAALCEQEAELPVERLLQYILVDSVHGQYPGGLGPEVRSRLAQMGINIVDRPIVDADNPCRHRPDATLAAIEEITTILHK